MSNVNTALGNGHTATIGEKELHFAALTKNMQDAYSEFLKKKARKVNRDTAYELRQEARALRQQAQDENLTEEERRELNMKAFSFERDASSHTQDLDARITAGDFDFGNDLSIESMSSPEGLARLCHISLKSQQSITLDECEALVKSHFREVTEAIRLANGLDEGKKSKPASTDSTEKTPESPANEAP